ncbi:hypothetical protein PUF88_05785 [Lactobacillaceae bacterium L1_55_11]|nr:hypothetical protein [Lactobacillaceae bacterium L1_55_11]
MTMVAATVIAYENDMPYFLVVPEGDDYTFFSIKIHSHDETATSLGKILSAFKEHGVKNFDHWRLGELSAVREGDNLMSLYSFEVSDWQAVAKEVAPGMVFEPADKIRPLLTTLEPAAFTSFEDL